MKMLKASNVLASKTKMNEKELRNFFNHMNKGQNDRMVNAFYKKSKTSLTAQFLQRQIQVISDKLLDGVELSTSEWKAFSTWENLTIKRSNITQRSVNSSWLLTADYNISSKVLIMTMIRGKQPYSFYNVPSWVFTALTNGSERKGRMWWNKNFWKYSRGKMKR